ncbi:hypothetical protein STEG23_026025, partial [Scotinomys teguina]
PKLILSQSRMDGERLQLLKALPISSNQQCLAHRKDFLPPWQLHIFTCERPQSLPRTQEHPDTIGPRGNSKMMSTEKPQL